MMRLGKGNVYMGVDDQIIELGEVIPFTEELEISAKENLSHLYNLTSPREISFEICGIDLARLDDFCSIPQLNKNFILEYSIPIMIQARWHKKSRIRKKWLKRYGMKPDTVKVCANAKTLECYPTYNMDEYACDNIRAVSQEFEIETDKIQYILRPDQKRRGLKIEW